MPAATACSSPIESLATRSAVYSLLAHAFAYPDGERVEAIRALAAEVTAAGLASPVTGLAMRAAGVTATELEPEYVGLCTLSSSPDCPTFETAYFSSDPIQQTTRMADIAGFYRAFGVDATSGGVRPDDLPVELLREARIVHASGISEAISSSACDTVLHAFEAARAAGARVSFDSNLRLKLWPLARARATISATAAMADYFFPSLEDACALSGLDDPRAILDWCHRLGAKTVFLKLGADGALVSDGSRSERIDGHRVDAVDATGAGDCFCGACLARIAAGESIWNAARYANAAAALSTTGFGAVAPLPRPDAVRRLLASG